jgi:hypothetical protein
MVSMAEEARRAAGFPSDGSRPRPAMRALVATQPRDDASVGQVIRGSVLEVVDTLILDAHLVFLVCGALPLAVVAFLVAGAATFVLALPVLRVITPASAEAIAGSFFFVAFLALAAVLVGWFVRTVGRRAALLAERASAAAADMLDLEPEAFRGDPDA